ncbi:MAG: hemerythrin family protein [Bryobacteraceae bacterium]
MRILRWSRQYVVAAGDIDDEHRALFQLADELRQALSKDAKPRRLQLIAHKLMGHIAGHFSHEERMMRSMRYPHYEWHKRQHIVARAAAKRLERKMLRGQAEAAPELLKFLESWLKHHIRLSDRMLGAFLRNQERLQTRQS